ncbi:MAG TPA: hypothetical protein VMS65_01945 [Polyangiaceae bacterium]|nr:hypothetical protein [Polyangiaceae bacterium]
MTPLVTKLVFISSSALGAATLGSTAYLVDHPRTFTPQPARPLILAPIPARPSPPAPVAVQEAIVLPAIVVTGSKAPLIPKAHHSQQRATPAATKALIPCSTWQDMGPRNVNDGAAIGERRVRTLCDSSK